ncbi:MAG: DNA-binding protein WhiA [Candidatus Limnocylindrales bacterium]|jgi:WhiA LAGLIDADG-like domain/WhiA C-terminal HTH domain|nr:DNA-binding protein WhiA [Candidatus Limnocylindrales bacterium]
MPGADRDLVAALRTELASIEPSRPCDRAAEAAGLGMTAVRGDRPALGRLMVRLLREDDAQGIRGATGRTFDWDHAADHCRAAYLRGRFLVRGSLSVTAGRYHLEFVVPVDEAGVLAARLAAAGLPAGVRVRRGRGVVTWKGGDTIGTFLRWIGAGPSLLELESRQVSRAFRGDLNRLLNAESANLDRIATAAARQVAAIAALEADGRLADQPDAVRAVAALRRRTPEASLFELATELAMPRGRVQRALARIEALALHPAGGLPDPPGGAEWHADARRPAPSPAGRAVA